MKPKLEQNSSMTPPIEIRGSSITFNFDSVLNENEVLEEINKVGRESYIKFFETFIVEPTKIKEFIKHISRTL